MKTLFILILFVVMLMIIISKDTKRLVWLMAGIFFLNDTISIQPFNSYTLLLTAAFCSFALHGELKRTWKEFPFKWVLLVILVIHILVVQFDERYFPPLTYMSRIFNNFVPRFLALFVGYAIITSTNVWRKSAKHLAWIFLIMCIYGFITFALQGNPYDDMLHMAFGGEEGIWANVQERGYRVFSTLNNPIVYGYVMFLAASYLYLQKKVLSKNVYYALLLLTVLNAFLANSRTGLVAGALLTAIYALIEYRFSVRILGFAASIVIVTLVLYQFVPFVQNAADSVLDIVFTGGENTSGSNVELKENQWETSLLFFYLHPYFGNGFNYFHETISQQYDTAEIGLFGLEGYEYKLLVEEGLFMIIAVIWLFVSLIVFFFKRLEVKRFSSMGIAWIISFLFFINGTGTYGGIFTIGMLFIGMLLKYVQIEKPRVINKKNKHRALLKESVTHAK